MLRTSCRFAVIASLSVAALLTVASDASAGHRHRKAKNSTACCIPVTTSYSHGHDCCSSGYSTGYSSSYMGSSCGSGCGGGCGSGCGGYPHSGATTVHNHGYSSYGTPMYYPNGGYQGSSYGSTVYGSSGVVGGYNNGYNAAGVNANANANVNAGANVGAAVGQAVNGNSGAAVGAAVGAAAAGAR